MEEDNYGSVFKLDKEFLGAKYCSIFELYIVLKDKNTKLSKISNPQIDQIFNKTLQYVERFNKFGFPDNSDRAAAKAVELRRILENNRVDFSEVEKSQLMNLLPQKAEEAMSLIPTLNDK